MTVVAIASLFVFTTQSQAQVRVGATLGAGVPLGDFGDFAKTGFGGSAHVKYFLSEQFALGLNIGYYSFGGEDIEVTLPFIGTTTIEGATTNIIPVTVAAEYYFTSEGFKPYAGLDLGLYFSGSDAEDAEGESNFGIAPTLGFSYGLNESIDLNVNAKYNMIFGEDAAGETATNAFLGINAGILFNIGGK